MARHRSTHPPARAPRRSQAERAEQMRARLLDATIECLATSGYGRMSTNDVVRKAHVSRGALAHHFPTKAALVQAAAQRLLQQRATEFRERFRSMAPERRTPAQALEVLWSFYDDPSGLALIELTVAARSHPELRQALGSVGHQLETHTAEVFLEFFPELARLPFAEEALRTIHAAFAGLKLSAMACDPADDHGPQVRAFLQLLVSFSGQLGELLPSLETFADLPRQDHSLAIPGSRS
ncbi:MAG TPA: TetR/AcrR family transcriptional regulator [Mycobacteriales bacterium]|jgi:AcrR family transcriptional regulator|nr:TetR/AcrR family transcriptional regulator [Mycobacteriales bacterium]